MKRINKGIWFYIRNYKFNSLFVKNLIIINLIIILLLTGITYLVNKNNSSIMEKEIEEVNIGSVYRIRDVMDTTCQQVEALAGSISLKDGIQMYMLTGDASYAGKGEYAGNKSEYAGIIDTFKTFTDTFKYLDSIYVYSEKSGDIITDTGNSRLGEFKDKNWYKEFSMVKNDGISIIPRKRDNIYPYFLSFFKPISTYQDHRLGMVIINVDVEKLGNIIEQTENQLSQNVHIVNDSGLVIYSSENSAIFKAFHSIDGLEDFKLGEQAYSGIKTVNGKKVVISSVPSKRFGWSYISVLPLEYYEMRINNVRNYIINFIILAFSVGVIISLLISVRAFQPLRNIMSIIENPEAWYGKSESADSHKVGEVGYISNNILNTLSSKKYLESELEKRIVMLHMAQAAALQAQINPHFLYNTLETINWKAIELLHGKNDVSIMLTRLASLLRISLDMENYLVPISNEVEMSELYIKILELRYRDMFKVVWNMNEKVMECKIIKLCLQPLIENAVYHGIKPKKSKGNITIEIDLLDKETITIIVKDDGIGVSMEETEDLNRMMSDNYLMAGSHIGIRNINQRIKLIYGEKYGVILKSEEGKGTDVQVVFPRVD